MKRENIVWGIFLILLGIGFLVYQLNPGLFGGFRWPLILVALGAIFTLGSLIGRVGGMMIPGLTLLGLGGIFYYQDSTGNWESWAYVWALLPALAGLGMVIGGLYDRELRQARGVGLMMFLGGLAAFAIFGGFFGLGPGILRYWPVLVILAGLWLLLQALRTKK
ncbi:conserved membrane protein of unknown function [Candidatus Promineifilum breve]|uniref:LiaF transmembrane domain-containing protein n=1 Tax=Candidatus Promineifilum breve TaxID=1806508 RepID=A0A160SXB5_9CHLR|nr:hypothetical protein [Candidatus Promineifilum breve]CUS01911.1 conserved membrane protein of unknown function [Candidatus Promineifilum breve]